ncbi:hypothetical protein AHAS_Ahas08G0054500 [Arachis hypogaea]
MKWIVKPADSRTLCGELEEDPTELRRLHLTRGYLMQMIGGILFTDASDTRVHIRWLLLLADLDRCERLSWGSAMLAWLYRQICRATNYQKQNLDNDRGKTKLRTYRRLHNGLGVLNVAWTPYADPGLRHIFPPGIAESEAFAAVVCPLLCFAKVEWHHADRVLRQFGGL